MILAASGRKCHRIGEHYKSAPKVVSRNPSHQNGAITESDDDMKGCPQSRQQFSTSSDCHSSSEQEFGKWHWCQSFLIFLGRYCLASTGTRLTYIFPDMQRVTGKT